jgi:hypothetical protein
MKIPADAAIHLLHEASHAVLATHSTQLAGYPYATAVPLVVNGSHQPVLLISALAEHTKNLLADPRASLSVVEDGRSNIQNAARMTLLGTFECLGASSEVAARYLRYQPEAGQYLELDFMFFRLNIERVRYIAGFGEMGWLDATDWNEVEGVANKDEIALLELSRKQVATSVKLIGVDAYGLDYAVDGLRARLRFENALGAVELTQEISRLVRSLA